MARPRGDDVRHQVLLETFAQIADRGVDGMSLRTLAAASGVSMGTITYHFTNKRQLLLDAISYGYQRPPASLREGDPVGNLHSLLRRYDLATKKRRTWWQFWLAVITYAQKDEEIRRLLAAQHHFAIERFRDNIADGIAAGAFEVTDVDATAERLVAHAHGLAVAQLVDPSAGVALRRALPALLDPILGRTADKPTSPSV
jgi:AcrR family transcriptional regulator